jgi:hypothetical protein
MGIPLNWQRYSFVAMPFPNADKMKVFLDQEALQRRSGEAE